jgi:hypothetical protein
MQPKLPADHPTNTPDFEPSPADRRDLVQPRPPVAEEVAIRDESEPPAPLERLVEDLEAVASPLVPEAGVAEGAPAASQQRNRVILICAVIGAVAALAVLLVLAR